MGNQKFVCVGNLQCINTSDDGDSADNYQLDVNKKFKVNP